MTDYVYGAKHRVSFRTLWRLRSCRGCLNSENTTAQCPARPQDNLGKPQNFEVIKGEDVGLVGTGGELVHPKLYLHSLYPSLSSPSRHSSLVPDDCPGKWRMLRMLSALYPASLP